MDKIRENYINTSGDEESYKWIQAFLKEYPTEKGYRIESFMSPKFIRVTVYDCGGRK